MKLAYPAYFDAWEDGSGYTVTIPDLPGCVTEGETLADAIFMAEDAGCGWVLDELESGKPAPQARKLSDLPEKDGCTLSLVAMDIDRYAEKYGTKAVRKNLTIPAWLNTFAEQNNINFSQVLQDAITSLYQSTSAQ